MSEGRESPSPSRQTGKQLHDPTGSGASKSKGEAEEEWKSQDGSKGTENLTSNPKGVLDDAVKQKFSKTA
ncbi:hypothetical protein SEPCBS119000_001307 [Sporothrix epigloea]|uniref:Uncharacterized protein n=1 Tax=Sporothrix epigloea TaxID=1892477 RepID=A0ABP0D9Y9_9PEZI